MKADIREKLALFFSYRVYTYRAKEKFMRKLCPKSDIRKAFLSNSNLNVSRICMVCMRFGDAKKGIGYQSGTSE